jgi:carboxymethylenebutenolidase
MQLGTRIRITAGGHDLQAYAAVPRPDLGRAPLSTPGVLVLHAWWGLVPEIESLCDRFAAFGYAALAPDFYAGDTAQEIEGAAARRTRLDPAQALEQAAAALAFLKHDMGLRVGRVGVCGLSLGGSMALRLAAARGRELAAVVAFYGLAAGVDAARLQMPVVGHFAAHDPFVSNEDVRAFDAALRSHGDASAVHVYPGTGHWFFESDRRDAYNIEAAQHAWDRTLAFFDQVLP